VPLETAIQRPTRFQTLAIAACAKLDEILAAEGRDVPTVAFGKVEWKEGMRAPRLHWMQPGGTFTLLSNVANAGEPEGVHSRLGFRVARSRVALWHVSPEHVEHMLDRLWMATDRSTGGEAFRWQTASYDYPTETEGPWLQNGHSVIVLSLPVELAVAGEYDGETTLVTVTGSQFRAGIENPVGEDPNDVDAEYDVNRWTG
jgi:hypothetical protein